MSKSPAPASTHEGVDTTGLLVNEAGQLVAPHECQNACGRRAAYVLVDIEEGRADIICGLCLLAMMAAVAEQVPPPGVVADSDTPGGGA